MLHTHRASLPTFLRVRRVLDFAWPEALRGEVSCRMVVEGMWIYIEQFLFVLNVECIHFFGAVANLTRAP